MNLDQIVSHKQKIREKIAKGIVPDPKHAFSHLEEENLKSFLTNWYRNLFEFSFLEDQAFEERIYHASCHVQVNRGEQRFFDGEDLTQDDLQMALEIICLKKGVSWNTSHPFVSFDLELSGRSFRASLLHKSLCAEHESKLFLRSKAPTAFQLESFTNEKSFLIELIRERRNILIAGGTGSGKTSFLNSLLTVTEPSDHLVVLEDTYEILSPTENTTRLLARQEEKEDLKIFMSHAMRMSPDRIVLGELRSSEAEPFLLAMNSGHKGLMSTIHANGAADAISRLALLVRLYSENSLEYELVTKLICQNVDYVIFMENKRVTEIIEVFGSEGGQIFFEKRELRLPEAI